MPQKRVVALASMSGTALVTAMVSAGWDTLKLRYARLLGRDDPGETTDVAARLEQSRTVLMGLSGTALAEAKTAQEIIWRAQLIDLLERQPQAAHELRALARAQLPDSQHADNVHPDADADADADADDGYYGSDAAAPEFPPPPQIEGQGGTPW